MSKGAGLSFPTDSSTQLNNALPLTSMFTTDTTPDINFNGTNGIYNPLANTIKIFTKNTDALTIDSNQCLYGNATGLTHRMDSLAFAEQKGGL